MQERQREVKEMVEKTKTKEDEKEFQIVVRGVDPEVWRRARSQAILQRENMGPLLTKLLEAWLKGKIKID
jgi:hypothetical protein